MEGLKQRREELESKELDLRRSLEKFNTFLSVINLLTYLLTYCLLQSRFVVALCGMISLAVGRVVIAADDFGAFTAYRIAFRDIRNSKRGHALTIQGSRTEFSKTWVFRFKNLAKVHILGFPIFKKNWKKSQLLSN